jgi:hypothetical protein
LSDSLSQIGSGAGNLCEESGVALPGTAGTGFKALTGRARRLTPPSRLPKLLFGIFTTMDGSEPANSFFAIFARSPDWSAASSPNSSARILEQVDQLLSRELRGL